MRDNKNCDELGDIPKPVRVAWKKHQESNADPERSANYKYLDASDLLVELTRVVSELMERRLRFCEECNALTEKELGFAAFDSRDDYDLEDKPWVGVAPEEFLKEHLSDLMDEARAKRHNKEILFKEEVEDGDDNS